MPEEGKPTCSAPKANGEPCRSQIGLVAGLCIAHDPERAGEFAAVRGAGLSTAASRRAARNGGATAPLNVPPPPKTLGDAVHWSSWAMHAVATSAIDARTGHEIGYLVNAFKGALEKRDLLSEIEGLRAELAEARTRLRA